MTSPTSDAPGAPILAVRAQPSLCARRRPSAGDPLPVVYGRIALTARFCSAPQARLACPARLGA